MPQSSIEPGRSASQTGKPFGLPPLRSRSDLESHGDSNLSGRGADALIDEAFNDIMYGGEKKKTWKQARSQIASSLAAYYKKAYLAVKGTPGGEQDA